MGVKITDLLVRQEITLDSLSGKKISVDAFNMLYQFITTIRQRDGSLLTDSKGNVTSHLTGLFARTTNLMQKNIKLAFVFDGKTPDLKKKERERRAALKKEAEVKHKLAVEKEDIEEMKKYAGRTSRLTKDMVEEAKKLLDALGIPVIQAPAEGEAQAAYMVKKGEVYALGSQDADCLLFGTPKLIRNLSITGKRKKAGRFSYDVVKPELVELSNVLNELGIDQKQLIALGLLVGTDYNIGGIKGIGPKNAIKLVKNHKHDFDALFNEVKWSDYFDFEWKKAYDLFENMKSTDDYNLEWGNIDVEKVKKVLCDDHDFSEARVDSSLSKLMKINKAKQQKGLGDFF